MKKTPLLISVLMCTTTLFSTNYANAQGVMGPPIIVPMPNPDVCGGYSDSWSANCRRDNDGNMHDGNSGNVYDPYGNPIRRQRPGYSRVQPSVAQPSGSNRPDKQACSLAKQYVLEHGSTSSGPYERYHEAFFYYLNNNCRQYFGPLGDRNQK
ncbi:MAG: hypothetical protein HC936_12885 [Leptolyngbyaceae cyanobacterium SU_3_3]|nr:hypothetical protein [Leptolyngbyaceae cyanobacterium SU_3_3]